MDNEKQEAIRESWAAVLAKKPAGAQAVIIAELHEDKCDMMSDYFNSQVVRTVAIGWRTGSKEDFRQLRRAAAGWSETAHLDAANAERRENYSMGKGNYLATSSYSGWHVRSYPVESTYRMYRVVEDHLPHVAPSTAIVSTETVTISENDEKDGVEIRFNAKPAPEVLARLKANGWRWSRFSSCWYARRTPAALAFAQGFLPQQTATAPAA